jgi:hypothetical protein
MEGGHSLLRRVWDLPPLSLNSLCDENTSALSVQLHCTGRGLESPRSIAPKSLVLFNAIDLLYAVASSVCKR